MGFRVACGKYDLTVQRQGCPQSIYKDVNIMLIVSLSGSHIGQISTCHANLSHIC